MNVIDLIMNSIAEILENDGFIIGTVNNTLNYISIYVDIGFGHHRLSSVVHNNCFFTCNGYSHAFDYLVNQCRVDLADPKMFDKILEFNRTALNKYIDEIARSEYMKQMDKN